MSFVWWRGRVRAYVFSVLACLGSLLAAACTGPYGGSPPSAPSVFSAGSTNEMFAAGYDSIQEYFIEKVKLSEVATRGLSGLQSLDASFAVERAAGVVQVSHGHKVIGRFPTPRDDDARAWAHVTANAIIAGRDVSAALADSPPEKIYKAIFDSALAALDRFSRYSTAEAAAEIRASRDGFGGIGVTLAREDNPRRVAAVIENSPAARAGLQVNDVFTHVDGQALEGLVIGDIIKRLRGPIDSTVFLSLQRAGTQISLSLQRAHIVPPTVTYRREGDIAYLRVSGFNQRTSQNMRQVFMEARAEIGNRMAGIVLDLRGNPGGVLDQAVTMSSLFVAEGEIVSIRGRHTNSRQHFESRKEDISRGLPIVVLIDQNSASAAEIVAAALQDSGRALVIGTRSFGKGTVQTVQRMPNGGEITLTWARFYAPSGYPLQDLGVMPTVCTSYADGNPDSLLTVIRATAPRISDTVPRQQRKAPVAVAEREKLGKACPGRSGGQDVELQLARQLL
ncbi:MAG: S41 family peptidase, partial [Alphaproteobacteria bacterium]|nr:S41 family peptidase [Alphaproteobacteria bacterium]